MQKPNQTKKPLWWDTAPHKNSLAALTTMFASIAYPTSQTRKLNPLQVLEDDRNWQTDWKKSSLFLFNKCIGVVQDYEQTLKHIHIRIALVTHHNLRVQSPL